jgi:anionic cell wall polymer biosynthesis LytR-Cps2A-Psr (LCP) family protein
MVVHISPGRHGVTMLSIPRDTQAPVYACAPPTARSSLASSRT